MSRIGAADRRSLRGMTNPLDEASWKSVLVSGPPRHALRTASTRS